MNLVDVDTFKMLVLNDIKGLEKLYDKISDVELAERLRAHHQNIKVNAHIMVPDAQLKRQAKIATITEDKNRVKRLKNTFNKRRLFPDKGWQSYPLGYHFD